MKLMEESDIPAFVQAVVATGCNITAVGDNHYLLGDADLPEPQREDVQPLLKKISEDFGHRDHLRAKIVSYLHSIGRSYPPPQKH